MNRRFIAAIIITFGFGMLAGAPAMADPEVGPRDVGAQIESADGPRQVGEPIDNGGKPRKVGEPIDNGQGPRPDPEDLVTTDFPEED